MPFFHPKKTLLDWIQNSISFLQSSVEFFFISNNILSFYVPFQVLILFLSYFQLRYKQNKYNTTTTILYFYTYPLNAEINMKWISSWSKAFCACIKNEIKRERQMCSIQKMRSKYLTFFYRKKWIVVFHKFYYSQASYTIYKISNWMGKCRTIRKWPGAYSVVSYLFPRKGTIT